MKIMFMEEHIKCGDCLLPLN